MYEGNTTVPTEFVTCPPFISFSFVLISTRLLLIFATSSGVIASACGCLVGCSSFSACEIASSRYFMTSFLIVRFGPTGCCLLSFSRAAFNRHERLPCCSSRPGDVSQEVSVCLCPLGLLVLLDSGGGVGVGQSLPFSSFGWF